MGFALRLCFFVVFLVVVLHRTLLYCEDLGSPDTVGSLDETPSHDNLNQVPGLDSSAALVEPVLQTPHDFPSHGRSGPNFALLSFHPPLRDNLWSLLLYNGTGHQENALSNATKNATNNPDSSGNSSSAKQDEDMPAFDEWRQQKLQVAEKEKNDNPENITTAKRRPRPVKNTNYASALCGAKVIAHNPEAENPGGILTSSSDEYMLNSCKAKKYFVVELCESVHVHGFDIGNLELFSNVPKSIQVSGSGRFPTRDWIDLGRFEMKESRTAQNFVLSHRPGFIKYIRVEIQEHYGKEHYCPVSLFRVYGTSMVEEYVAAVDDDDDDDGSTQAEAGEAEDAYMERDKWGNDALIPKQGFGNGLTDFVVSFVKKVSSSGYQLLKGGGRNSTPVQCRNASSNSIPDLGPNASSSGIAISAGSPLMKTCLNRSQELQSVRSTCHYVWSLLQAANATLSFCPEYHRFPGGALKSPLFSFPAPELFECEESVPHLPDQDLSPVHNHHETAQDIPSRTVVPLADPMAAPGDVRAVPTEDIKNANEEPVQAIVAPTSIVPEPVSKPVITESIQREIGEDKKDKTNAETVFTTLAVPVAPPVNATPGQRESVFVRMGNRLKVLELNTSLSGQYLHELSRRFKKQSEDTARNFSVLFLKLSEYSQATSNSQLELKNRLDHLERRNALLEQLLNESRGKLWLLSLLFPALFVAVFCMLFACLVVGLYIFRRYAKHIVTYELQRDILIQTKNGKNGHVKYSHSDEKLFEAKRKRKKRQSFEGNHDRLSLPD